MAGINIPFLAEVRNFLRGGDQVTDKLDDVSSALDDVARAGDDTGRALDDTARDGADAAEKLETEFSDALATVRADGKATGKSIGDDLDRGAREAADGIDNLRDEADGTAREVAASFDGSAEGIAEGFQEVAANAFAGFGPAGAAAGLAAAAGIGIAIAKLTEVSEEINEAKEAGVEWASSFNQAGLQDRISGLRDSWAELTGEIRDSREWYELGQESAVTAIEQIADAARDGAGDVGGFIEAFNVEDPAQRLEALRDSLSTVEDQVEDLGSHWRAVLGGPETEQQYLDRRETLEDLGSIIEDQIEIQENANEVERAHAEALGLTVEQYRAQQEAIAESAEAQEAYAQALEDLADPVSTYEDLLAEKNDAERETAEATAAATSSASDSWEDYAGKVTVTTDDLIEEWNRQAEEAQQFQKNLAIIAEAGGQALADELRAKGPEIAGSVAAVIAEAGPGKRAKAIEAHARATGEDITSDMSSGVRSGKDKLQGAVDDTVGSVSAPDVPLGVSTAGASYAVAQWRSIQQAIPVVLGLRAV